MIIWDYLAQGFTQPGQLSIIIRIVMATILGFLIGWNRRTTSAGIRTFSLITLGSTIFTIIAIQGFPNNSPSADLSRVVAQIVSGIGFIGAGVIWKTKLELTGLTTAATIWAAAGIGIAIGVEMFSLAVLGTLIIIILLMLKPVILKYESDKT